MTSLQLATICTLITKKHTKKKFVIVFFHKKTVNSIDMLAYDHMAGYRNDHKPSTLRRAAG